MASLETRMNKLMKIDGMSEEEAQRQIESHKREREAFLKQLAQKLGYNPNNSGTHFDFHIEINTDYVSFQEASNLVLLAAERYFRREAA